MSYFPEVSGRAREGWCNFPSGENGKCGAGGKTFEGHFENLMGPIGGARFSIRGRDGICKIPPLAKKEMKGRRTKPVWIFLEIKPPFPEVIFPRKFLKGTGRLAYISQVGQIGNAGGWKNI